MHPSQTGAVVVLLIQTAASWFMTGLIWTMQILNYYPLLALIDAEAIRVARARQPRAEIAGSRWQASTAEVRSWALAAGFELGDDGAIPEQAITAYNQTHPDRPY